MTIPQTTSADPSVPDAATALATQDAAEKTKAMGDAGASQQAPVRQETMTKSEQSSAMPLPGQANDHSAIGLDAGKPK